MYCLLLDSMTQGYVFKASVLDTLLVIPWPFCILWLIREIISYLIGGISILKPINK